MNDHTVWDSLRQVLKQHFTVIAIDLIGFGDSDRTIPAKNISLIDHLVTEVDHFIKEEGIKPVGVLGHSMGGVILLELLRRFHYTIPKVIISDTPYCGLPRWLTLLSHRSDLIEKIFRLQKMLPKKLIKPGIKAFSKITIKDTSVLNDAYYKMIARGDSTYAARLLKELAAYRFSFNFKPEIKEALICRGACDRIVTSGALTLLAEFLGGHYEEIAGISHAPMIEAPVVFQEMVTNFFRS